MAITANQVIARAKKEVGNHESPPGSNRQKYGAHFKDNGVAWCAIFVSWVFDMLKSLPLIGGFDDYTVSMAKWFYNRKQWGTVPRKGAIVFFHFGNPNYGGRWKGIHHTGIVIGRLADGRVVTIEGNTSAGSNANGGAVQVRYRHMSNIAGFGYPKYAASKPKPTVPTKPSTPSKPAPKTKTGLVTARSGLRVRSGSGTDHKVLGTLPYNSKVTIVDEYNGWYKIKYAQGYGGGYGHVNKKYVKLR